MSGKRHRAGVAVIDIDRLQSIITGIEDDGLSTPSSSLRRWHVGLDLTRVPRELVENTSDLLRKATAHLDLPPARPEIAVKAVEEALSLWQPLGGGARRRALPDGGRDDVPGHGGRSRSDGTGHMAPHPEP